MEIYWLEQTLTDVPSGNNWLGARELVQLSRLRFPKRRDDWRLGRWTAKQAVAVCFNFPSHARVLARIEILPSESGAPEVFFRQLPAPVTISLTHSSGRAACCVAAFGADMGCDLETIEPRGQSFITDYFTDEEQRTIASAPEEVQPRLVSLMWSAKESALKALHTGLRLDTRSVVVNLDDASFESGGWRPMHVRYEQRIFRGWWQHSEGMIRTMVAQPVPKRPIFVKVCARIAESPYALMGHGHMFDSVA